MTTTEPPSPRRPRGSHRLTTAKAMVEAIELEMERDPSVFYLGEDVGAYGGIFSSTTGLLDTFGPQRVIDTPISETAFIGLAIGAAVEGMRPIVELMFADFMGVCLDQIYNHMAKIHFESGGNVKVPMVLTTAVGGGYSDGAQHSQCLWGTFAHLPGMKVVVPSNPYDAKGLMTSAIRDDNPVVYMFHKGVMGLPWMAKNPRTIADVPDGDYEVPIGKAAVARDGTDVTVVTLSLSVHHALDVAEKLDGSVRSRSSTCAPSCRSTGRRSSPRWPRPGGSWSWTRTTCRSGCPARSPRRSPTSTRRCCARRWCEWPTRTRRFRTRTRWSTPCCRGRTASRQPSTASPAHDRCPVPGAVREATRRRGRAVRPGSSPTARRCSADQLIAEVQVDKVAAEVPAPQAGVITLLVKEDDAVVQGTPIARID